MSWFVLAFLFVVMLIMVGGAVAFCMSRSRSYQQYVKTRDEVQTALDRGARATGHRIKL